MTGIIRTATLIRARCRKEAELDRCFEMATAIMISRHEDNRMEAGKSISQINTFVHPNKHGLCNESGLDCLNREGFLVVRGTLSAQGEHLKFKLCRLRACARVTPGTGAQMAAKEKASGRSFSSGDSGCSQMHRCSSQAPL